MVRGLPGIKFLCMTALAFGIAYVRSLDIILLDLLVRWFAVFKKQGYCTDQNQDNQQEP
jgi:hypothetical protein